MNVGLNMCIVSMKYAWYTSKNTWCNKDHVPLKDKGMYIFLRFKTSKAKY